MPRSVRHYQGGHRHRLALAFPPATRLDSRVPEFGTDRNFGYNSGDYGVEEECCGRPPRRLKLRYLANNCVKALLLIRHVRFSTLGGFTKGLFLVLHPNIAVLVRSGFAQIAVFVKYFFG